MSDVEFHALEDLCSPYDETGVARAFVEHVMPRLGLAHVRFNARRGVRDLGLFHGYGDRLVYRLGPWVLKATAGDFRAELERLGHWSFGGRRRSHNWTDRESGMLQRIGAGPEFHEYRAHRVGRAVLLLAPWVPRVPPAADVVPRLADLLRRIGARGVLLWDCPWPTLTAGGDGLLVLDLGRWSPVQDPAQAVAANLAHMVRATSLQVEEQFDREARLA